MPRGSTSEIEARVPNEGSVVAFERWITELQDLYADKQVPHKSLLLLSVNKAVERDGTLPEVLRLSPELIHEFKQFDQIVAQRRT